MSNAADWPAPLLLLEDFGGDWRAYVDAVYQEFVRGFIASAPTILGLPVRYRWRDQGREPPEGKAATFWHIITEGGQDPDRLPDLRRCERIGWLRIMLDAVPTGRVLLWENHDRGERRILITLPDFTYVAVLADRRTYLLLLTAYPVEHERRRKQFQHEYERFVQSRKS